MADQFYTDQRGDSRKGDVSHNEVTVPVAVALGGAPPELTFARVAGGNDTLIRTAGSWIVDGFLAGYAITVSGTVSNNGGLTIAAISTDVNPNDTLEFAGDVLVDEVIGAGGAQVVLGSIAVAAADPTRRYLLIQNVGVQPLFLRFDEGAAVASEGYRLAQGEWWEWPNSSNNALYRGVVAGVVAAATSLVLISEA